MKTFFLHSLFLVLMHFQGLAQNGITGHPDWQIKPVVNQGIILVHRTSIGHLVTGYPTIVELNISKPTLGNKLWHHENNFPDVGVSLQYIDFKNPKELGHCYAIAPYIEIPLSAEPKPSRMVMRLCWGLTYMDNSFDIDKNHKNVAIGSPFNAYVQFKWFWQLQLTKNMRFEPGFGFNHASNGKAKNPNLGLNLFSLSAGLNIRIPSKTPVAYTRIDSSGSVKSKNELLTFAAFGVNQRNVAQPELYTLVISAAYQRNVRNTHKFSGGFDFYCDQNYAIDYENVYHEKPSGIEQWRISAKVGYSYNVGRISFPIEIGYYVYQKTNPDAMIVSRLGVRYYSRSGVVVHFGLRTHYAVAYNFEYGLGYRFYLK